MLQCLKQNKNSEVMDPKCKQMITKRQITQNTGIFFSKNRTCLSEVFCMAGRVSVLFYSPLSFSVYTMTLVKFLRVSMCC